MNRTPLRSLLGPTLRSLLLLTVSGVSVGASAGSPYFSGPSVTKVSAPAAFAGNGFVPNASVTVMVEAPGGSKAGYSAVTAADGSFHYTLVPAHAGAYKVVVTDSGGRPLASTMVNAMP